MTFQLLDDLAKLPAGVLAAVAATAGAIGAITAAVIAGILAKFLVTPFLSARDKQDREVEWRKHALELAKLDLDRKLKSGRDFSANPLRPSVLDFLANYRDLRELSEKSPAELYALIVSKRTNQSDSKSSEPAAPSTAASPSKSRGDTINLNY